MDRAILVDSNVYIDLLRRNLDPVPQLTERYSQIDLAICGIVRVEVLRGVKIPNARKRLTAFFDVLQTVPTDSRLWRDVVELAWTMDRRGLIVPAPDIAIACCARRIGADVLTMDKHFCRIPDLPVRDWDL